MLAGLGASGKFGRLVSAGAEVSEVNWEWGAQSHSLEDLFLNFVILKFWG